MLSAWLHLSVELEHSVTVFLGKILNIDFLTSKLIGSAGSLGFAQKFQFLVESKYLDKTEHTKFSIYAEVRNKFAHAREATDLVKCFDLFKDEGNYKKLKQFYYIENEKFNDREDELQNYFTKLHDNLTHVIMGLYTEVFIKSIFAPYRKEVIEIYDEIMLEFKQGVPRAVDVMQYFSEVKNRKLEADSSGDILAK